jgi:hypothetical protein
MDDHMMHEVHIPRKIVRGLAMMEAADVRNAPVQVQMSAAYMRGVAEGILTFQSPPAIVTITREKLRDLEASARASVCHCEKLPAWEVFLQWQTWWAAGVIVALGFVLSGVI